RGRGRGALARLAVTGARFSGRLAPAASGIWRLDVATAEGGALEGEAPQLALRVVPDSAPVVTVPVPGRDTTLPLSLRQPLVIDVRDDHGLSRLQVVSWRVSRTGKVGDAARDSLDVSGVGDRAIVQGELDAARRGLLPGDTLRFRVEAWDNAPAPHLGRSAEVALRLPSLEEVRAALRAATRGLVETADSIAGSQRDLGERTGDLAQQRSRDETAGGGRRPPPGVQPGTLPFQATERAQAVAHERQALQRLAEAQQQLKAELERSRELFQRAASEGALASLAADAEDLKRRQAEWNDTDARRPDSAAAARERALEERADSLAHGIEQVRKDLGLPSGREAP